MRPEEPKRWKRNGRIGLLIVIVVGIALMRSWQAQRQQSRLDALLLAAATQGDVAQAKRLLSQGANIEARRRSEPVTLWEPLLHLETAVRYSNYPLPLGYTPLMLASIRGDEAMVAFLLGQGADSGASVAIHGRGATPLSLAREYNHPTIVTLLKQTNPSGGN